MTVALLFEAIHLDSCGNSV